MVDRYIRIIKGIKQKPESLKILHDKMDEMMYTEENGDVVIEKDINIKQAKNEFKNRNNILRASMIAASMIIVIFAIGIIMGGINNRREQGNGLQQGYQSYVCDMANDGIIKKAEKDWWSGLSVYDESVVKEKNFKYGDLECIYEYQDSHYLKYSPERVDVYYNEENGVTATFYSGSGEFAGIHYNNLINDDYYMKKDVEEPNEYTWAMAKMIATTYIDSNDYSVEKVEEDYIYTSLPNSAIDCAHFKIYTFEIINCSGKYATGESVYVSITEKGDLLTLSINNIGLAKKIKELKIDEDKIKASVESKLKELYDEKYKYSYEINEQIITFSPENKPVMVSDIKVHIESSDDVDINTNVVLATALPPALTPEPTPKNYDDTQTVEYTKEGIDELFKEGGILYGKGYSQEDCYNITKQEIKDKTGAMIVEFKEDCLTLLIYKNEIITLEHAYEKPLGPNGIFDMECADLDGNGQYEFYITSIWCGSGLVTGNVCSFNLETKEWRAIRNFAILHPMHPPMHIKKISENKILIYDHNEDAWTHEKTITEKGYIVYKDSKFAFIDMQGNILDYLYTGEEYKEVKKEQAG